MTDAADQPVERPRLESGTVLRDTYTVECHLGSGRFADAYLVRHRFMGMQVLKLLVDGLEDTDRVEGLHEAFLLSRISHPGVIRVFDANRIEESLGHHPYITMEYASGGTLQELLAGSSSGLRLEVSLDFAEQIARGLGHAHALGDGIVHRDVKPGNILLEEITGGECVLRLGDFGLAATVDKVLQSVGSGGTILYMSPESLRGFETPASDVYSAGLVLYEMLTGTLPFPKRALDGATRMSEIRERLGELHREELPAPSYFDSNITEDVDSVVMRSLHVDLDDRFPDGIGFAQAIAACRHVQRAPDGAELRTRHAEALREAFAAASRPGGIPAAADRLDQLLDEHPELVRVYLPHLRQMRLQMHSGSGTKS